MGIIKRSFSHDLLLPACLSPSTTVYPTFYPSFYPSFYHLLLPAPLPPPPQDGCIAVGLSTSEFPLKGKLPGWDEHSWGLHGDDGRIFHGDGVGRRFDDGAVHAFGAGDTVGCAVDVDLGMVFWTLNGAFLGGFRGSSYSACRGEVLYPTVGLDSWHSVVFNFGERPFLFDIVRRTAV